MTTDRARSLADVIEQIPAECYARPSWKGLLWMARDLLLYAVLVAALIRCDQPLLLLVLWPLTALAISGLFILGHDAAHGALFESPTLNAVLGRLAMLPALHLYAAWVFGHNRIHHGHTTRQGMDYVWHPVTPDEYAQLPAGRRTLHRLMWSWLGGGIYYLHQIWWQKMVRFTPPRSIRSRVWGDRLLVGSYVLATGAILFQLGAAGGGGVLAGLWMWVKVFAIPFLLWNYVIGITVYVHHIAPDIRWRKRRDWTKRSGQLEGTTVLRVPGFLNFFMHNIFIHVPHHVDMRVPFYALPRAADALRAHCGDGLRERSYGWRDYLRATRACKLFDFERGVWSDYAGRVAGGGPACASG